MTSISLGGPLSGPVAAPSPIRGEVPILGDHPERVVTAPRGASRSEEDVRLRPGRGDSQPSEDDGTPRDGFQLSNDAVERLLRADPALERRIRAEAAAALERAQRAAAAADNPVDQAAFRAEVIEYLKAIYMSDPAFARALERGTIVVRPAARDEDPQMQPEVTHAVYRTGAQRGGATQPGDGVHKTDFVAWWPH